MKRKIYTGFDITKFVLAIFVICIHTHPFAGATTQFVLFWTQYGFHFSVPLFFTIAGFLLFIKTKDQSLKSALPNVKKYLIEILKLYVVWSIVYMPIAVYGYYKLGISTEWAVYQYIRDFFLVGEHHLSWHLWYLLGTIYGLIVITIMIKLHFSDILMLLSGCIFYGLSVFIDWNMWNIDAHTGIDHTFLQIVSHTIVKGRLLTGVSFLCMGMYIARSSWLEKIRPLNRAIIFSLLVMSYVNHPDGYGDLLLKPMIVFCGIWLLSTIKTEQKDLYIKMRSLSTVFYFTHMLFVFVFSLITNNLYPEGKICFLFVLTGCILTGFIFLQKESIKCIFLQKERCH